MNAIYFPILKAKDAEFDALRKASSRAANSIVPLFEVPKFNPDLKKYKDNPHPKTTFLSEIGQKIGDLQSGRYAMFDTYHWQNPAEKVESGEHHLSYLYSTLKAYGVNVVPVVGYDRWDDDEYRFALRSISKMHFGKFCIRLERFAFDDANDPDHFHARLEEILEYLELNPKNCHVVFDLEDVSTLSIADIFSNFDLLFSQVVGYGFSTYSVAGCSLPNSIDQAVRDQDSCGTVLRREMLLWKNARKHYPTAPIFFGDYGVRGPSTAETGFGNTNAKIRYTIDNEYFVVRGHVIRKPIGGHQHCDLATMLINSGHYQLPAFSWGDKEIKRCADGEFGGGSKAWITIDTSHHMAYVVEEIAEFERTTPTRMAPA